MQALGVASFAAEAIGLGWCEGAPSASSEASEAGEAGEAGGTAETRLRRGRASRNGRSASGTKGVGGGRAGLASARDETELSHESVAVSMGTSKVMPRRSKTFV